MPRRFLKLAAWFQCAHEFGWPRRMESGGYYQVCLRCGVEYHYDWHAMRRTGRVTRAAEAEAAPPTRRPHRGWNPRERRIRCDSPLEFRLRGAAAWSVGTLENVSRSGVLFHAEPAAVAPHGGALKRGDRIELALTMPEEVVGQPNARVLATGRVARITAGTDGGPVRLAIAIESYRVMAAQCA